jgi:hypothetical protein
MSHVPHFYVNIKTIWTNSRRRASFAAFNHLLGANQPMILEPQLLGRISRRGTFTSLDGTVTAPVQFGHAGRAVGARQHVKITIGRREFYGVHKSGAVVSLFRYGQR